MNEWFAVSCVLGISAAAACAAVLLARGILWKAPKRLVCFLWLAVFIRAAVPVSIQSPFSVNGALFQLLGRQESGVGRLSPEEAAALLPVFWEAEEAAIASDGNGRETGRTEAVFGEPAETSGRPAEGLEPGTPVWIRAAFRVWLTGAVLLLSGSLFSWMRLTKRVSDAVRIGEKVYESDRIPTAFVLGFFSPKIYLPAGLSERERELVEAHERMHCKWQEPRLKAVLWLITAVCWYHPALWISFAGWNRDMEMACDERVLRQLGQERKKEYGSFLLKLSSPRPIPGAGPLAFGESSVKARIKNIVSYRPCRKWAALLTALAVGATVLACVSDAPSETEAAIIGGADGPTSVFVAGKAGGREEKDGKDPAETERAAETAGTENMPGMASGTAAEITAETASAAALDNAEKEQEEFFSFAQRWAEAVGSRDADRVFEMLSPKLKEHAEELGIFTEADGRRTMGWSSPFWAGTIDPVIHIKMEEEPAANKTGSASAVITYPAQTSDPLWYVWKDSVTFEKTKNGWQTSEWEGRTFFDITTAADFAQAYAQWKPDYQNIPDGMRKPAKSFGDWLAENAQKGEAYALEYADPVRALELTLHLSGGSGQAAAREDGTMEVTYTFPDGAVTVRMAHPKGSGGELIWVPVEF